MTSLFSCLALAGLAAAACGGASDPLGPGHDGGSDSLAIADTGSVDTGTTDDAGNGSTTTCGAAVACGVAGLTYKECTEVTVSGQCAAIVYQVSSGTAFTCTGCSACEIAQQALSAYCGGGGVTDAGVDTGASADSGGVADSGASADSGADSGASADSGAGADSGADSGAVADSGATVDAAVCTVGAMQCVGSDVQMCGADGQWGTVESDPIWAVESSADGGLAVINFDGSNGGPSPTGTGVAPDGAPVTFTVWTAPGVSTMSIDYWLDSDYQDITDVPLTLTGVTASGLDVWTGTLAAQSSGTEVTWWAQGTDVCHTGTDYYSNAGNNYTYETP